MNQDTRHMARALELAARGRYTTFPNPRVGCVIVRDGEVVGEGFHERAGGPHAEVAALAAAGDRARGADVYVSLEPCCHHGRTPPCTDALIRAGVGRVVAAMQDPNPKVAGNGLALLHKTGIKTEVGVMAAEAEVLNRGFVSRMRRGRPWLTLKLGMTLDGRTALASGKPPQPHWITGPESRADVHRLRAEAGAVLTTAATVLADDPQLTARDFRTPRQPDRIVLDSRLRTTIGARVWAAGARCILLCGQPSEAWQVGGVEVVSVARKGAHLDLPAALATLGSMEINEVLVECGPTMSAALLQAGLVDELVLYVSPSLLGAEGRSLAQLNGELKQSFQFTDVTRLGADLRLTLRPG